ncbi:MAG TPA: hypothetical protein VKU44_06230 [Terriglobia bacterium]|nr:hypothetical protein [Terriglobia bacterium]
MFDTAQIGIEVAVPQLKKSGAKSYVCKDVVIWHRPKMTAWNQDGKGREYPQAVIEFKSLNRADAARVVQNKEHEHETDITWLCETSKLATRFVGYAVLIDQRSRVTIECARANRGKVVKKWLSLGCL